MITTLKDLVDGVVLGEIRQMQPLLPGLQCKTEAKLVEVTTTQWVFELSACKVKIGSFVVERKGEELKAVMK